jgi:hypothetical protein
MARRKYGYYDFYYQPTHPIEVEDGIKARSQRGAFAKNWWATRWIQAMERLVDSGRLARGRNYARKGQVRSIEEARGGIHARVQGSRPSPYKVTIRVSPLTDAQWEKVVNALAEQAIFTAQLLAGEMPQDIEQAFQAAGVSLFPEKSGDLETESASTKIRSCSSACAGARRSRFCRPCASGAPARHPSPRKKKRRPSSRWKKRWSAFMS